ncbi:hypothetical protein TrST_g1736 [Triparma strigata]|uniref:Saccharopine dehydrogenase NADP binding domain-containing protein n=1 Tax=Triparma strigata TaxID=1606541 RepID=A0A9W7BPU8_9STRA|nr:hypothetical protein TrST_g1736 [Triparma strigata]
MPAAKKYDLVLYGATGFTGTLAVKYLTAQYGKSINWAIAGRSKAKLEKLSAEFGGDCDIIVSDSMDEKGLTAMIKKTKVVASAAGPFARYGTLLVSLCAKMGCDYCDITGETNWVREMIALYDDVARETKARIVHHCGHDSVPWDLSAYLLANKLSEENNGENVKKFDFYDDIKSAPSGGTLETAFAIMFGKEKAYKFTEQKKLGYDALLKTPSGAKSAHTMKSRNVDLLSLSSHPSLPHRSFFFMAPVNANAVKRSNALNGYGNLTYTEGQSFPNIFSTIWYILGYAVYGICIYLPPLRYLMRKFILPKPGQGPSEEYMDSGYLHVLGVAKGEKGTIVKSTMSFNVDPGYKDTARMLIESALSLSLEDVDCKVGVYTPGACQKEVLLERLLKTGTEFKYH